MNPKVPFPPREFMRLACGDQPDLERHFVERGSAIVSRMAEHGLLHRGARLLDVGCGCGRVARLLIGHPTLGSYQGFDRHPGMVNWCQQHLASRDPRFAFSLVPVSSVYSAVDGEQGTLSAKQLRFPYPDGAFDSALLASVFTHMPLVEVVHYLSELARVLSSGGVALVSVFLAPPGSAAVDDGHNFFHQRADLQQAATAVGLNLESLPPLAPAAKQHWLALTCASPPHQDVVRF